MKVPLLALLICIPRTFGMIELRFGRGHGNLPGRTTWRHFELKLRRALMKPFRHQQNGRFHFRCVPWHISLSRPKRSFNLQSGNAPPRRVFHSTGRNTVTGCE
jgi:hypothetical protein